MNSTKQKRNKENEQAPPHPQADELFHSEQVSISSQ